MGGYSFSDHGVDLGDEGGVLIEGVFDLGIPFAGFEFVEVYGECDDLMRSREREEFAATHHVLPA